MMQVAILAGGKATRMGELTVDRPKFLLAVGGRTFADLQLAWLASAQVKRVVLCVGHLGDQIQDFVGDGSRWGLQVDYVDDGPTLLGTGGALRRALDARVLASAFAVLYGDSFLTVDLPEVWRDFEARRPDALMCTYPNRGRWDASNTSVSDGMVARYEKGVGDPAAAGLDQIDYGLSVLNRDRVVSEIPPGEPTDLADLYSRLAAEGRLAAHEVGERFYEVGSPGGLTELEAALRSGAAARPGT
jgi:NDP-sugar pyrophosphorylase family protein